MVVVACWWLWWRAGAGAVFLTGSLNGDPGRTLITGSLNGDPGHTLFTQLCHRHNLFLVALHTCFTDTNNRCILIQINRA